MANAVQHVFDATANSYDRDRSRLIPGFEDFYRWVIELIPPTARNIVDLGAGTGLLSAFVRARFQDARLRLIDMSEAMLAKARVRFAEDPLVTVQIADFSDVSLAEGTDVFVSALAIHHLADDAKQRLFRNALRALNPGGVFVNAEQVLGPTPELEERYKAIWLEQVRTLGASEEQITESLFRQREDRCASVEEQLAWMSSAGFVDVDCWYKNGRLAVLAGRKAR